MRGKEAQIKYKIIYRVTNIYAFATSEFWIMITQFFLN